MTGPKPSEAPEVKKPADKSKPSSTMETAPKLAADAKGPDPEVVAAANALDIPKPGEGKAEHFGEAGVGAEEVGTDTHLKPGKNVGLQNVSAEAYNQALAEKDKSRAVQRTSRRQVSDEQLDKMSPAEIRAVAKDRNYELEPGGRRSLIRQFKDAQEKDETLEKPDEKEAEKAEKEAKE